jgi:hypothetical protein
MLCVHYYHPPVEIPHLTKLNFYIHFENAIFSHPSDFETSLKMIAIKLGNKIYKQEEHAD